MIMEDFVLNHHDGSVRYYHCDENDKDKYIVFCIAKNEEEYIVEFIEHYIKMGFDKVIICDNNDDQRILSGLLDDYINRGVTEIYDFSGLDTFQIEAYTMYVNRGNFKWCAFFDCDEFLELNGRYDDVKEFLNDCEGECIKVNWMMYGSNGQFYKKDGTLDERFKYPIFPLSYLDNTFIKSIVRGGLRDVYFENQHCPVLQYGYKYNNGGMELTDNGNSFTYPMRYQKAYIKHYYTKSYEEFIKKVGRGWPDTNDIYRRDNNFVYMLMHKTDWMMPIEYNTNFLFPPIDIKERNNTAKYYDLVQFKNPGKNYQSLIIFTCNYMKKFSDYTLMIEEDTDPVIYSEILGYAIKTGNRIITYSGDDIDGDKVGKYIEKYAKKNKTYYIWTLNP